MPSPSRISSSRRSSPVKSGKSLRSRSPAKSVKTRSSSAALSLGGTSDGGKKTTETVDERGLLHLNMNNQGLTVITPSVFEKSNMVTLDLGCNNLQKIPPQVSKLRLLMRLCLAKNSIRCTNANDFTGLPLETAHLTNLEELDVSECNFPYVPPVIWRLTNLRRLNISRNKINMLVPEVGNLTRLQHLNAQLTKISTLPAEIAFCQDLEVLLLFGNTIDSLPETLREMPSLHTLSINYQSFCSIFDAYMENLLQKGQIQSEHIPPVVFEIPSLRALNLEATKINMLPEKCATRLEEFYLNRNFLSRIPSIVPKVLSLRILNLSDNFISSVPNELCQLRSLETLRLDNNQIEEIPNSICHLVSLIHFSIGGNNIPVIPSQIGSLSKLKTLILNRNKITEVPEAIINLTELETLDLTSNQITALPICFYKMASLVKAHTYDKLTKTGLWLHLNPITVPPEDVWRTVDSSKIYTYLKKLEIKRMENLQQQKLIVLGDEQSGKTSLVRTMIAGKSFLTDGVRESTAMLEYTMWRTENDVPFMVLDLGGHSVYKISHSMFLDQTSIYMLVYDHERYSAETHNAMLGYWLSLLQTHAPGAIVKVIGSKTDNVSDEVSEMTLTMVQEGISKQLHEMDAQLETEIGQIDTMLENTEQPDEILEHLREQRIKMEAIKGNPLHIHGDIALVSCNAGIASVLELVEELEYLAVDKRLRPRAQRCLPENWLKYRCTLKLQDEHCLTWNHVMKLAKNDGIFGSDLLECLQFFSEIGEVLWFENIPDLKTTLFHKPRKLVEILSGIFRHDMETFLNYSENRVFASRGEFSEGTFAEARTALQLRGQVSRPMLRCLWFYLHLSYADFNFLCELVPKLDLCYLIPQPEIPARKTEFSQLLVIPAYNEVPHPADFDTEFWPATPPDNDVELKLTFTFPIHYPHGVFERLAQRVQSLVYSRLDWQDLIWAEAEATDGETLTQTLLQHLTAATNALAMLTMSTRSSVPCEASRLLKELCTHLCLILQGYPGVVWYIDFCAINCKEVSVTDCLPGEILESGEPLK